MKKENEVEYEWECWSKSGGTCGKRHKTEIKAKGCCANNDALIERELRAMTNYEKRLRYVSTHTREPVRLMKKNG